MRPHSASICWRFAKTYFRYVNGTPHLGHAFTVSKVEFASRVARAQGKNTLYPQGFHATGMPIKACADMLVKEISIFGKNFEQFNEGSIIETVKTAARKEDITKVTNEKKSINTVRD